MKKRLLALLLISAIVMSACGDKDNTDENSQPDEAITESSTPDNGQMDESSTESSKTDNSNSESSSDDKSDTEYASQVQVLYDNRQTWEFTDGKYKTSYGETIDFDDYGYAVTDLDNDSNIEILASGIAGSGRYSTDLVYEYDDEKGVIQWDTSNLVYDAYSDSEPDFLSDTLISDSDLEGKFFLAGFESEETDGLYLAADYESYGVYGGKTSYLKLSVNDDTIVSELIATVEIDYSTATYTTVKYADEDGNDISFDSFTGLIRMAFYNCDESFKYSNVFNKVTLDNIQDSYGSIEDEPDLELEDLIPTSSASELNETVSDDIEITVNGSLLDYSDIDEESKQLYRDYLEGNATAIYKNPESDTSEDKIFKSNLKQGKSYSFDDLKDIYLNENEYSEYVKTTCTYIDCGLDGEYELLVQNEYSMYCFTKYVLKNIDGKLYICFTGDSREHKWNEMLENGFYSYTWNIDGLNHWGSSFYIDADGEFYYLYSDGFGGCDRGYGDDTLIVSLPDDIYAEFDEIGSIEYSTYSFSDSYSEPHYMYNLVLYDPDGNEIERNDESEDLYNRVEVLYEACGNTFVTEEEANEAMKNARLDAGLTDEIYEAEVGFYE